MTLINKGMRNLKIAEILDSGDFAQLTQFDKAHLVSVIINRLYYGIYLIGKINYLQRIMICQIK